MKQLREQIKKNEVSPVYLFTGEETYLIQVYLNRYLEMIFKDLDKMMNLDRFDQESKEEDKIIQSLITLPFFAEKRVVILQNLDLFNAKSKTKLVNILETLSRVSDTTICFVIEEKADKRSKLFKYINENGIYCNFSYLDEGELISFVGRELNKSKIKISTVDAKFFLHTVGYDLNTVNRELGKLIDYVGSEEVANHKDIEQVCVKHLESKIFDLVDAIGSKNRGGALSLYQDMVQLKEPPTRILFMITRQLTLIFQVKLLQEKNVSSSQMASDLKLPGFVVNKLIAQGRHFNISDLKIILKEFVVLEYDFKSGKINLETGIELMLLKMSQTH